LLSTAQDDETAWVLEWEDVDPADFEEADEVPDIALEHIEDDRENTWSLSLCNLKDCTVIAYVTVYELPLRGRSGAVLQQGCTTDNQGVQQTCTTLIVLCPPRTFAHLCTLQLPKNKVDELNLESDVQEWNRHPDPTDTYSKTVAFPLQGGPFCCTQGVGGHLTHFFAGNLHAIDFRCPVGTPLLAAGNGVVVSVQDNNTLTGIAVSNLFIWNSILLRLDEVSDSTGCVPDTHAKGGPLYVEYVHIQNAHVKAGDRVETGQVIGLSGSVGFSPEPHLHFASYRSSEATAATVKVYFRTESGQVLLPAAGKWYDGTSGEVEAM
jgi:hypothetical protein